MKIPHLKRKNIDEYMREDMWLDAMHDIAAQNPSPGKYIMNTKINGDVCIELVQPGVSCFEHELANSILYYGYLVVISKTTTYEYINKKKPNYKSFLNAITFNYPIDVFKYMKKDGFNVKKDTEKEICLAQALKHGRCDVVLWLLCEGYVIISDLDVIACDDNNDLVATIKMKAQMMESH